MRSNLQLQITGIVVALSLLIFSVVLLAGFTQYRQDLTALFVEQAEAQTLSFEASIGNRDTFEDTSLVLSLAQKQIWLEPDILEIHVNVHKNGLLHDHVSSAHPVEGLPALTNVASHRTALKEDTILTYVYPFEDRVVVISPVHISGQILGTVEIDFTSETISEQIASNVQRTLVFLSFSVIAYVLILLFLLRQFVVSPILKINAGLVAVARGDLKHKINIKRNDEIGQLASSFDNMRKRIGRSKKQLEDYSKNLEKKVAQRTRELKKKGERLQQLNTRLKDLDRQKDAFISIAAHELKNPITSIRGFSELMLKNKKNARRTDYVQSIHRCSERLLNLTLDLVDSTRMELGKLKISLQTVSVKEIMNELRETTESIIRKKGLTPSYKIEAGVTSVKADPARLLQILRNLTTNALRHTEEGSITVFAVKKGDTVQFNVADTGSGIPKEKQSSIFGRYYQVNPKKKGGDMGSGLGLYISKGLVELMKGKIWFTSSLGKGTTFSFTIPQVKKSSKSKSKKT